MKSDNITAALTIYVLLMGAYWFIGEATKFWAVYYYSVEKLFAAFGFYLLYRNAKTHFMRGTALYCLSLCLFMIAYFVYCYEFGHQTLLTVATFIVYSLLVLYVIRLKA